MGIDFERLSDEELIEKGKVGEKGAINQLLRRYWQRICAYAMTMLGSVEDAEDAAQETLLRVFRWRGSFREGERFAPWIYKIATNVCFDRGGKTFQAVTAFKNGNKPARTTFLGNTFDNHC